MRWKILTIATASALTLSACGVAPPTRTGSSASPTASTVAQGESVQDGGLTFKVTDMWEQKFIGSGNNPFSEHDPRGIWVVIKMHVQNDSDKSQGFDSMHQTLIVGGKKFSPDTLASGDIGQGLSGSASLNPGFGDDVGVAFDVPNDTLPADGGAEIELHGDMMSPGVFVRLTGTVHSSTTATP